MLASDALKMASMQSFFMSTALARLSQPHASPTEQQAFASLERFEHMPKMHMSTTSG